MILLPHFTRALLGRSLLIWLFVRLLASGGSAMLSQGLDLPPSHPLFLSPDAALLLVAGVAGAGWAYARRNNEDVFLLCLGYGRARLMSLILTPPLLLEVALGALARA